MSDGLDPVRPKRSLFKRPTWAQDTSAAKVESPDIFGRSQNYHDVVAERERHRREKAKKKKKAEEGEREKRRSGSTQKGSNDSQSVKRRRISDDADLNSDHVRPVVGAEDSTKNKEQDLPRRARPSASTEDKIERRHEIHRTRSVPKEVIELADSSDNDQVQPSVLQKTSNRAGKQRVDDDDEDESDPEFAALARQAREARRLREQKEQDHQKGSGTPADTIANAAAPFDPTVQLFITSSIPNSAPLIVSRKLSQRLQEVREAWCNKQGFEPDFSATVFFTYQLRKLYDVTTCKSLGVNVDSNGKVIPDDLADPFREHGEHDTKIHIEAVTPQIWEELKAKKAAGGRFGRSRSAAGGEEDAPAFGENDADEKEQVREEATIKLTLKAKGYKDVKIKVRPTTTFASIANGARKKFGEQDDRIVKAAITLEFDGDRLEPPEGMVRDTDIDDMDCIDVHVK
ncbi:hypothetical protein MBLNU459_g0197t1 [Dothideomycetes sp. NU459]